MLKFIFKCAIIEIERHKNADKGGIAMFMAEKIKIALIKRNMSLKELAEKISTTPSNLSNKMRRDNFPENELHEIAKALDCTFDVSLTLNDTGERI